MGCCQNKNLVESIPGRKSIQIKSYDQIPISPRSFVLLNQQSFFQVYKLDIKVLGKGLYGQVRKCWHKKTNHVRIAKIIHKTGLSHHQKDMLFQAKILRELDHPNIIKVYQFFQDESNFYIIIQEMPNAVDLFTQIEQDLEYDQQKASVIMKNILQGVAYCHQMSLVHRDLKPQNILLSKTLTGEIRLKIIDFGTATFFDRDRLPSGQEGTPYYMAPEVFRGKYDQKCDIWSCGIILYCMLTAQMPIEAKSEKQALQKLKAGKLTLEKEGWERIPQVPQDLIKRMLDKNPLLRPSALQALQNPWISGNCVYRVNTISRNAFSNIRFFKKTSKLKQALCAYIVSHVFGYQDLRDVEKVFHHVDYNGKGVIQADDLRNWLGKFLSEEEAQDECQNILNRLDADSNGVIDYTEFVKASMDEDLILTEANIRWAFQLFDRTGQGHIRSSDLKELLTGNNQINDEVFEIILDELGMENEGSIGVEDFISRLLKSV